ncbi:peptidase M28 [marine sediment metagenome]|uniref:Peptidase M28 n=1 Tax=marine sediment metagenome TaxID=412755 RepID=A0A1B6NXT6_9ZZZZ
MTISLFKPFRVLSFASLLTAALSISLVNAETTTKNAGGASLATLKSEKMKLNNTPIDLDVYREHVKTLASDEFEGRGPLSKGEKKTVEYLVSEYKNLGSKTELLGEQIYASCAARKRLRLAI